MFYVYLIFVVGCQVKSCNIFKIYLTADTYGTSKRGKTRIWFKKPILSVLGQLFFKFFPKKYVVTTIVLTN